VGYPALLAVLARTGLSVLHAAWVVNLVAAAAAAACAASLGQRVAGSRGGYLGGLAYALAPGATLWCAAPMPETLAGALLVAAVTVALVPAQRLRVQLALGAATGILVGAAALIRPQWLLAAPLLGALPAPGRVTRALAGTACALAALLVVLPWTARNCAVLDGCALVATGDGAQLFRGTVEVHAPADFAAAVPRGCGAPAGEVAQDGCFVRAARARIAAHPGAWLRLGAARVARAFGAEWTPVNYLREAIPGATLGGSSVPGTLVCSVWWWLLALGALFGGRRAYRVGGAPRRLVGVAVLLTLLLGLVTLLYSGGDAAHLALLPLFAPLAAGALLPPRPPPEAELVWAA
jgi:hypothetical protein